MRFSTIKTSALPALAVALMAIATPAIAQDGEVDLIASAKEKAEAFSQAFACTAVFRLENWGIEEAKALDELRPLAPMFGRDTDDKLDMEIEREREHLARDAYEYPDEFDEVRSECILRYSGN